MSGNFFVEGNFVTPSKFSALSPDIFSPIRTSFGFEGLKYSISITLREEILANEPILAKFVAIWRNLFWRFDKTSKFGEN